MALLLFMMLMLDLYTLIHAVSHFFVQLSVSQTIPSVFVEKMQPAFKRALFGLKVGQLSDIVNTSSGVHIILRLA
jgi:hypothetical protein